MVNTDPNLYLSKNKEQLQQILFLWLDCKIFNGADLRPYGFQALKLFIVVSQ